MNKSTHQLKKGSTFADVLDDIEAAIVTYMQKSRGIDEQDMRKLLDKDSEVRASYQRKIERSIQHGIANGMHPSCFGRAA